MASRPDVAPPADSRASAPPLHYASFEARVAAGALDFLVLVIVSALFAIAGSLIILISSDFERVSPSGTAIDLFWVCIAAIPPVFILYLFVGYAWRGQTAGAAVMQLEVVRSDGRELGVLGSLGRVIGLLVYVVIAGLGAIAAFLLNDNSLFAGLALFLTLAICAAGLIWAAFDNHRRTLHDRIAGTIVVHSG